MQLPSFIEDHISQVPALQLLMKMGWQYLTPDQALEARNGRSGNVLLETVLKQQLQKINSITYKEKEFEFSEANINTAILALRDLPVQDGFLSANQVFYDLVTLGKSIEQAVMGDKKSFSFRYIDWACPENNIFHVTEEFSVLRSGRNDHYRPDIVLFVNGIPMVVIECKSPAIKDPIDKAIEQHLRNQQDDGIRSLYLYSNMLIGLAVHEAKYATTATEKAFWNIWREIFYRNEEETNYLSNLSHLKNAPLPDSEKAALFSERYKYVLKYFEEQRKTDQIVTEQDKLLYSLCRPARILRLIFNFIVFDDGIKKIARYQQYFSVNQTLQKIAKKDMN
ncbi:MAG TPA: type I restriction endonuclease, partial [Bacteroidales bacterium]|nr:type I restriction endonuclease [Bacteroidales bacterium]